MIQVEITKFDVEAYKRKVADWVAQPENQQKLVDTAKRIKETNERMERDSKPDHELMTKRVTI